MNIFLYPIVPDKRNITKNPYISNLIFSLENSGCNVVNKNDASRTGILSLALYFLKTDLYYFNWIENLPYKKFGYFQSFFFLILFFIIKLSSKKIIWTFHNATSHYEKNYIYDMLFKLLLRYSDFIVFHSKESFSVLGNSNIKRSKIFYFFHPIDRAGMVQDFISRPIEFKYDILIWGTVNKYKGVFEFVEYIVANKIDLKVFIAGKFLDDVYYHKILSIITDNITIENRFFDNAELKYLHSISKCVLFPYISDSVLNSGSLTFSLDSDTFIIGPNRGAFKELSKLSLISVFNSYDDVLLLLSQENSFEYINRLEFINNHTWQKFSENLLIFLNKYSTNHKKL